MCLPEVASDDGQLLKREEPKLSEEFPEGSEHAYGVAAQVSGTTEMTVCYPCCTYLHFPRICIHCYTNTCSFQVSSLLGSHESIYSKLLLLVARVFVSIIH